MSFKIFVKFFWQIILQDDGIIKMVVIHMSSDMTGCVCMRKQLKPYLGCQTMNIIEIMIQ